ncbi:MAG TPA: YciI family protein, partial [Anaerolineales bacterium]
NDFTSEIYMPDYIYLIRPVCQEFFDHPTQEEDAAIEAHFEYLKQATSQGRVFLAGPCLDRTFGVVILTADNEAAAHTFMMNDPAISKDVMMAELHPMKISLRS